MVVAPGEAMATKVAQAADLAVLGVARVIIMAVKVDRTVAVCWELGLKEVELELESALEVISVEAVAPGAAMVMKNQSAHAMGGQANVVGKDRQVQIVDDML